jgi:hypothetical protein
LPPSLRSSYCQIRHEEQHFLKDRTYWKFKRRQSLENVFKMPLRRLLI